MVEAEALTNETLFGLALRVGCEGNLRNGSRGLGRRVVEFRACMVAVRCGGRRGREIEVGRKEER